MAYRRKILKEKLAGDKGLPAAVELQGRKFVVAEFEKRFAKL
jgi:hypothetical protein